MNGRSPAVERQAQLRVRVLSAFLFGVDATDPLTIARMSAVLLVAVLAASYVPARRAMGVDPAEALREE